MRLIPTVSEEKEREREREKERERDRERETERETESRIQSECGKVWTKITTNTETFYAVIELQFYLIGKKGLIYREVRRCCSRRRNLLKVIFVMIDFY